MTEKPSAANPQLKPASQAPARTYPNPPSNRTSPEEQIEALKDRTEERKTSTCKVSHLTYNVAFQTHGIIAACGIPRRILANLRILNTHPG